MEQVYRRTKICCRYTGAQKFVAGIQVHKKFVAGIQVHKKFVAGIQVHKNLLQQFQTKFAAKVLTNFSDSQVPLLQAWVFHNRRLPTRLQSAIDKWQRNSPAHREAPTAYAEAARGLCVTNANSTHTQSHALQQNHHQ